MARIKHVAFPFALASLTLALWLLFSPGDASAHNGVDDGHPDVVTQSGSCGSGQTQARDQGGCTHGPDTAPPGVTPRIRDEPEPYSEASFAVCNGNGTSGKRVQVLYVHASDVPSAYDEYLTSFQAWSAKGDSVYQRSAAQTGGMRYIRFVHDSNCVINVKEVTVTASGDDDFWSLTGQLWDLGYHDANRKYLVFLDNDNEDFCGQADVYHDDSRGQGNANNTTYGFAVIYSGCWSSRVTISHELGHNFGAVQASAPHSSKWDHCYDEWDVMCYDDGSPYALTFPCEDEEQNLYLDCNKDDYYNTNPAAGSYLATHWNVANSAWLGATNASVLLDRESVKYNGWITAALSGYTPGSTITVYWADKSVVGTVVADSGGKGTVKFRAPLAEGGGQAVLAKDSSGMSDTELIEVIPRVNVNTTTGIPGDVVRVYLYGFVREDVVDVLWEASDGTPTVLATVTIADTGRASVLVTIPYSWEPGKHSIRGRLVEGGQSATVQFTLQQTDWTVALDKEQSKYNGSVTATLAGFAPNSPINLTWQDGTGLGSATTNGSGGATITFKTPLAPLGDYGVLATDGSGHVGVEGLRVIPRVMLTAESGYPLDVVRVYYYGFAPSDQVETRWFTADGSSYQVLNTLTIAENGRGTALITIPDDGQPGAHTVRGSVVGISRSASLVFTEIRPTWAMTLSTSSSKYNGTVEATLTGFSPGKTVTLTWPDGTVLGSRTTNSSGATSIKFRTPLAPLGDYVVLANDGDGHISRQTLRVIPRITTNVTGGDPGSAFRVYLYGYAPGDRVQIRWYGKSTTDYTVLGTVTIASNGRGSMMVSVPWSAAAGANTLRGSVTTVSRSASTTFTVNGSADTEDPTVTPTPAPTVTPTIEVSPTVPDATPVATETVIPTATATPEAPTETPVPIDSSPAPEATEAPTEPPVETPVAVTPTPYVVTGITRSTNSTNGAQAVDGDPGTIWTTTDDGSSPIGVLQLDYGQVLAIGVIRILTGPGGLAGNGIIEVSEDGETWIRYAEVDGTAAIDDDGWITVTPDPDVSVSSARYVRIVFPFSATGETLGNIAELVVLPPD